MTLISISIVGKLFSIYWHKMITKAVLLWMSFKRTQVFEYNAVVDDFMAHILMTFFPMTHKNYNDIACGWTMMIISLYLHMLENHGNMAHTNLDKLYWRSYDLPPLKVTIFHPLKITWSHTTEGHNLPPLKVIWYPTPWFINIVLIVNGAL